VTTFDHRDPGRSEQEWLQSPLMQTDLLATPTGADRLLVVAAHPDDETLGVGGLIAAAHRGGASVVVVIATDGERSHPGSPTHAPRELAARRRREVQAAVTALAPDAAVHFLGLPDGSLDQFGDALSAQIEYFARTATHVLAPWVGDGHPDHAMCGRAAESVAHRHGLTCWQYPIWAWHWADPDGDALPWRHVRRVPLDDTAREAKSRALDCHQSQHAPLSDQPGDEAILGDHVLAHFRRDFETLVVGGWNCATTAGFFETLYERDDDPWGLATRFYERRKRAVLMAALPRERFRRAFEPGCATGLLTEKLAERCDEVVAWDLADRAVEQTWRRTASAGTVQVQQGIIPDTWPDGRFDLIVLSEVGYYCSDLDQLVSQVDASLDDDGALVACHWRHPASEHPHSAETVHDAIGRKLRPIVAHVEDDFLLNVWTRTGRSVAVADGIVR
jgi:LmbE family N-acetylglucosaminyl deacetylase/SAM-dependent methyltransferase